MTLQIIVDCVECGASYELDDLEWHMQECERREYRNEIRIFIIMLFLMILIAIILVMYFIAF